MMPHVSNADSLPASLDLVPISRRPTRLSEATIQTVLDRPLPRSAPEYARAVHPVASIVIATHNQLVFTRLCLESVLASVDEADYEVVVVDNGSTDGTAAYLHEIALGHPNTRVIFNATNRGFAPAVNQGLERASGDVLVLLNNDTIVPRGWLTRLLRHSREPGVGLVGPLTNRSGDEAQIDAPYRTYGELVDFAQKIQVTGDSTVHDVSRPTMFCLAMSRELYARVGPLDEQFEVGMFEDDDYAVRVQSAGYRAVRALDVFVHHFGQATLGELVPTGQWSTLFEANRRRFEEKWGIEWRPRASQASDEYRDMVDRIRAIVGASVPTNAMVAVLSRGDDGLLELSGRSAWHFPRSKDGGFAGYYPADSAAAISQLRELQAQGGEYLVVPRTSRWWLEHYQVLKKHLDTHAELVVDQPDTCLIFALPAPGVARPAVVGWPAVDDQAGLEAT